MFSWDVCSCTFKNMDWFLSANLLTQPTTKHTHSILIYCSKRGILNNWSVHLCLLLGQGSDGLCSEPWDGASFTCINTITDCCCLSTLTVYFSPKMWYQALENYLPAQNKSIEFIYSNGALLYKYVCFPTVSLFFNLPEVKHVKMHRNKREKKQSWSFF